MQDKIFSSQGTYETSYHTDHTNGLMSPLRRLFGFIALQSPP